MSGWSPHTILPEVLYADDEKREQDKDRQIIEMKDRIRRLEDQIAARPQQGLGGISIGGFELTTNVLMFSAIIGLVVYILADRPRQAPRRKGFFGY